MSAARSSCVRRAVISVSCVGVGVGSMSVILY